MSIYYVPHCTKIFTHITSLISLKISWGSYYDQLPFIIDKFEACGMQGLSYKITQIKWLFKSY